MTKDPIEPNPDACQQCGRDLTAGEMIYNHHGGWMPDNRIGGVVVDVVDGHMLAICRWCAEMAA